MRPVSRFAYVKNGDAVDQVARILGSGAPAASGPDAFLADLLAALPSAQLLVLSRQRRAAAFAAGNVAARVIDGGTGPWSKIVRKPAAFAAILLDLLRFRPERIVCGCLGSRLWAATLAARLLRVPIVYSGHNRVHEPADRWPRRLEARIDRLMLRWVDGAVCHGPYLKSELAALGIPRGSEPYEFDVALEGLPEPRTGSPAGSARTLLFVGRLEREKGVFDLLEAAEPLLGRSDRRLVFVGGGRVEAALRERIERSPYAARVHMTGALPHAEVLKLMREAWVVATPSRPDFPEGRCMAAMEALTLGVPVVAPGYGPFPFLVQHEVNGLLFKPGNVAELSARLAALWQDELLAARLRQGAARTSQRLRSPPLGFADALRAAFRRRGMVHPVAGGLGG